MMSLLLSTIWIISRQPMEKAGGAVSENTTLCLMMTLSIVLVSFSRHCCGCWSPVFSHCLSLLCPMSTDGNSEIPEEVVLLPML